MKILRIILSLIVVSLSVFMLITEKFEFMPYSMMLLALLMLVSGLVELQKDKKGFWGYANIVISLFLFYVSIQGFLLN